MSTLLPLDLVDLGLVIHFLDPDGNVLKVWEECIVALSAAAAWIALARRSSVLVLQQRTPAVSAPTLLGMPRGDHVRSLAWVESADDASSAMASLLLAGCASGHLRAYTADGAPLWSVRPRAAPLISVKPHTYGPTPDVLLTFGDGALGHASASWLGTVLHRAAADTPSASRTRQRERRAVAAGVQLVSMAGSHAQLTATLSCGPLPPLPLDMPNEESARSDAAAAWPADLCFIAAGRGAQLHLVERFPRSQLPQQARSAAQSGLELAGGVVSGLASSLQTAAASSRQRGGCARQTRIGVGASAGSNQTCGLGPARHA